MEMSDFFSAQMASNAYLNHHTNLAAAQGLYSGHDSPFGSYPPHMSAEHMNPHMAAFQIPMSQSSTYVGPLASPTYISPMDAMQMNARIHK